MIKAVILFLAFLLIMSRIYIGMTIEPESATLLNIYKDLAHVFIGGLVVGWWFTRKEWVLWASITLIVVEISVAIISRVG